MILLSYLLWNSKRVEYINTTLSALVRQFNGSGASTAVEVNNNKIIGTIKISAIDIEYPIIKYASPDSLEHAITWFTGADLNQKGNVVLAGNKANGDIFFTNLNRLRKGDEVTIVDSSRRKLDYLVADSFVTDPNDKSVLKQDKTKYELTLISCEKDLNDRYIVKLEAKPTSSN
jgi:LPXTG-site transpeptidase (sortase) family protein